MDHFNSKINLGGAISILATDICGNDGNAVFQSADRVHLHGLLE